MCQIIRLKVGEERNFRETNFSKKQETTQNKLRIAQIADELNVPVCNRIPTLNTKKITCLKTNFKTYDHK